jgi:hypothetical protein
VPKRTNDFQALIALVERQLAASGVRVVESEMLADRLTGELREVDVCVHATVSGKDVTLAMECRDHKRKADQIWIDTLRGKYAKVTRPAIRANVRTDGAWSPPLSSGLLRSAVARLSPQQRGYRSGFDASTCCHFWASTPLTSSQTVNASHAIPTGTSSSGDA